ncbi:MAG: heme ABC exporter ATP-binding protein CcmA [Coriobacteriales bacterium]|jgi:heme exporter protein A|nr:heme ABC exporter ATP-binding protein CcmA [Coriobacteriales bacterium]
MMTPETDAENRSFATDLPVVEVHKLSKSFGARTALDNVSFSLPEGAFLSIFGPNGAGKTTLLRVISTLERPSSGAVRVFDLDLKEQPEAIREHIGFVSHRSLLYPDLTAEENLEFTARLYGMSDPARCATHMLATVELTARRHDLVRSFSRGMTQRLAIARALICDPHLVFLDEPYSGLDPHAVEILDELLATIRQRRSFIMVSHDLQKGFELSTHVLMLAKGRKELFAERSELAFESFANQYHAAVGMEVA